MAQLAVWMVVCVAIALTLQRRPILVLGVILALRILIPSTGGWVLIGNWQGSAAIHPATLLLLTWAPFFFLSNVPSVAEELRRHRIIHGLLSLAVVLFAVVAIVQSGPTSLIGLTNSVLAGVLFFFSLRVSEILRPGTITKIARILISLMIFESLLVVFQWITGTLLPWSALLQFALAVRPLGTFDSPLDLGLAAALVIPLLVGVRRAVLRYVFALILAVAVVLSESRTPTIFAAIGLLFLVFAAMRTVRSFVTMIVVVGLGSALVFNLQIFSGLAERFTGDDGNSAAARSVATDYIMQNIGSVLILGNGWGSSYQLKGTLLETSLENGYAILAFDLGGVGVLCLLLAQVLIVLRRKGYPGSWLAAVFAIAGGFAYSGITTMSAISIVMWTVFASRLHSDVPLPQEQDATTYSASPEALPKLDESVSVRARPVHGDSGRIGPRRM
ncbi:hypothetical protein [Microbacterium sp. Bi128]|uniref:hypothetical protein n=1 Tax=Microbacterium sp. Bi128 TaxID=2821115 RepID=UPI001DBE0DF0|nr:hypothetical protein [Microbacterium sp. Bi128]CAH0130093.1 hypothetical protein SRABI128_00051 [Microbacterium sp. Bi128]